MRAGEREKKAGQTVRSQDFPHVRATHQAPGFPPRRQDWPCPLMSMESRSTGRRWVSRSRWTCARTAAGTKEGEVESSGQQIDRSPTHARRAHEDACATDAPGSQTSLHMPVACTKSAVARGSPGRLGRLRRRRRRRRERNKRWHARSSPLLAFLRGLTARHARMTEEPSCHARQPAHPRRGGAGGGARCD